MRLIRHSASLCLLASAAFAQATHPNFAGAWEPYRGGPGQDPKLAPPAATPLVLKEKYAKPYEDRRKLEADSLAKGEQLATGGSQCIPYGMPTMMQVAVYPMEVVQTPERITIITEAFTEVRRVFLDRPQLPADEVPPGFYGRSVGKWEGDTLVIDTVAIHPKVAGYRSLPHSNQMRITERMRLAAPNILHDQITITDPEVLEKPLTYTLGYKKMSADYEMVEFVCENNREYVDEKGVVRMKLKQK
jgi:hypothetical protein